MTRGATHIEDLRDVRDPSLSDASLALEMIRDGDLHHVDGDLVQALNALLCGESATAFGCSIIFDPVFGYVARREDGRYHADPDALQCLIEAQSAQRQPWLVQQRWNGAAA